MHAVSACMHIVDLGVWRHGHCKRKLRLFVVGIAAVCNMLGRRLIFFFFFNDQLLSLISILSRSSSHYFVFLQQYVMITLNEVNQF